MILSNMLKCELCGDIIESRTRHGFVTCKCGTFSIDGGNYYRRILIHDVSRTLHDCIDLSVTVDIDSLDELSITKDKGGRTIFEYLGYQYSYHSTVTAHLLKTYEKMRLRKERKKRV